MAGAALYHQGGREAIVDEAQSPKSCVMSLL
jgi:hypothetical protein